MATVRTMSSAAKIVIKNGLFPFASKIPTVNFNQPRIISAVPVRWGSFTKSPNMDTRPIQTEVEFVDDPKAWEYVENLIKPLTVPSPKIKDEYPSGWKPPAEKQNAPYFIQRSRNHMIPVYLKNYRRSLRTLTIIRRVRGDIWYFGDELQHYLTRRESRTVDVCVNEAFGTVYLRGDHVNNTIDFLEQKGF